MFKREAIIMASIPLVVIAMGIIAAIVIPNMMDPPCENKILSIQKSPNDQFAAVIFWRNCGSTTGFNTQVSLIKNGEKLKNQSGNLFVADTDHGKAPVAKHGGPEVNVYWLRVNNLIISYPENARVFKKETELKGVHVDYNQQK